MDDNPHWKDLIKVKSGLDEGGWFSMEPRGSFGMGPLERHSKRKKIVTFSLPLG